MSEFTPKDNPNFHGLDYEDAEPRPADSVILKLPGIPAPENTVPVGTDIQPGQTASASPNKENVLNYQLFVQKEGAWTFFEAASPAPIETSTVQDLGDHANISINGGPPQFSQGQPSPEGPGPA